MQPTRPSRPSIPKASTDVIFVLGAGVDRALGLPLLTTLFRDLSEFARGSGKAINKAIRNHAKPLPLDLQTYGGDQAENLGQKLLGSHPHLLPKILTALDKHRDAANARVNAIKTLMKKLATIATENELNEVMMAELSKLTGEADTGVTDTLLDPNHIAFRPKAREAIKAVFTQVLAEIPDLTAEEREAFAEVITILSNFEELMGDLFTGYFTKHIPNQKKYFYLAWLLWAYIRHQEDLGRARREHSFYKTLSEVGVGGGVITFNYTDFFYEGTRPTSGYFHGDCKAFIRFHTREYVSNNVQARDATTLERIVAFIDELKVDWKKDPPEVSLPAIIPPLAIKPIICTDYLDRWYECGQTIKKAKTIVIVGYSFSVADEHFNDLIRKGNREAKLIVIDPDIDAVVNRVCQTINHDKTRLKSKIVRGLECRTGGRLTFVRAKAEEVTSAHLMELLSD